jgi:two-component system response regulator YesN
MLKIYIADDDRIIRRGLRAIIQNSSGEYEIVGEADNGRTALTEIENLKPDLLIADIKMPVMNGIELIKNIRECSLDTKVIVLSGFDDYPYVRESMKYGAVDYLLKPIENEALLEIIKKCGDDIFSERAKAEESRLLLQGATQNAEASRNNLLLDLIDGAAVPQHEYEYLVQGLGFAGAEHFLLAVAGMDNLYRQKKDNHSYTILHACAYLKEQLCDTFNGTPKGSIFLTGRDGSLIILFYTSGGSAGFEADVFILLQALLDENSKRAKCFFTIGTGPVFHDLKMIRQAYSKALCALQKRFYEGRGKLIEYLPEDCAYENFEGDSLAGEINSIISFIEIGDADRMDKSLLAFLDRLQCIHISPARYRNACSMMIHHIIAFCPEFGNIVNSVDDEFDLLFAVQELDTLSELRKYLSCAFYDGVQRLASNRMERNKKIIEMAKEYIHKHYSEDISLKSVSDYVYLSPTYFCEYFRNETGKNFLTYLTEIRIEAAKKLLAKPELKIYNVGQMVGYEEPTTFIRAFKKNVGLSPSEYRNVLR